MHPRLLAPALLLLLPGCIAEGWCTIRGRVTSGPEGMTPVAGATVTAGKAEEGDPQRVRTSTDGTYELAYAFGGIFPFGTSSNPTLVFAAPGHEARRVKARSDERSPGVVRGTCEDTEHHRSCVRLDVVLDPLATTEAGPGK